MKKGVLLLILFTSFNLFSQVYNPINWTFQVNKVSSSEAELIFKAKIDDNWHLYGMSVPADGPIATSFKIKENADFKLIGNVIEVTKPEVKLDENFQLQIPLFSKKAIFKQKIKILNNSLKSITGSVEFMACDDKQCLPPKEEDFRFILSSEFQTTNTNEEVDSSKNTIPKLNIPTITNKKEDNVNIQSASTNINNKNESKQNKSLWLFFLLSFIGGLGSLLTPCVFPMIPMNISFFLNSSTNKYKAISNALVFGFSIIFIYTLLGFIVSLTQSGSNLGNVLSTHWIPNSLFFVLFIIFGLSFLGLFEIVLPGSLAGKTDQQVDKGGFIGSFFMALTTIIVSFSCTGPIVGSILIESMQGLSIKPVIGMLGYSIGFALPYSLLAMFPSVLKNLPKSGGWLNSVKVFFAFILLAFSLKFISNIDQTYHLNLLSRQLYLSIWIASFLLLGLYLLGLYKLPHDTENKHIGAGRLLLTIVIFSFVFYLIPGLFGAPLHSLSAVLPPQSEKDFSLQSNNKSTDSNVSILCNENPLYSDILHLPYGLKAYFDYNEGMECAKKQNKPALIIFKGHQCSNCKEMEAKVWSDKTILNKMQNNFVIIALYVDDKTKLTGSQVYISSYDGKEKNTIGKKNIDFQITKYKSNTQPFYVIEDVNGNLLTNPIGTELEIEKFNIFLDKAKTTSLN